MSVRLAHVAVVVRSIEAAARLYAAFLDERVGEVEEVPEQGVRVAFVPAGGAAGGVRIELIEATDPSGAAGRFLASRGEGIHHLAFYVPDLEAALARAQAAGFEVVPDALRSGAEGRRVAFLHPRTAHGALIELIQA